MAIKSNSHPTTVTKSPITVRDLKDFLLHFKDETEAWMMVGEGLSSPVHELKLIHKSHEHDDEADVLICPEEDFFQKVE